MSPEMHARFAAEYKRTFWRRQWTRARFWFVQLQRKFPRLVWYGQEIEVNIQFVSDRLHPTGDANEAIGALWDGPLDDARKSLMRAGVEFDQGMSCEGRDWQWDWSLRGPVRVEFLRVAKRGAAIERARNAQGGRG